jgi:hypothetical protein
VSIALADDYAQRSQRSNTSQYRLAFDLYSDAAVDGAMNNDYARFDCGSVQLDVTYLLP